jgi:hypothetical protein
MVMLICGNDKDCWDGDGCIAKCMQHMNTMINLQNWSKTLNFKDDHGN